MLRRRNNKYKQFLKTRLQDHLVEFKQLRNSINTELRRAKNNYYSRLFSDNGNLQVVWQKINGLINNSRNSGTQSSMLVTGREIGGDELANSFNAYFTSFSTSVSHQNANIPNSTSAASVFLPLIWLRLSR